MLAAAQGGAAAVATLDQEALRGEWRIGKGTLGDQCSSNGSPAEPPQAHRKTSPLWHYSPGLTSQTNDSDQNRSLGRGFARLPGNRSGLAFGCLGGRRVHLYSGLCRHRHRLGGTTGRHGQRTARDRGRPKRNRTKLPFPLRGIDSDNGSEFINTHLFNFCQQRAKTRSVQFTRSRPYKKDDNAHVEQKNWTHVRKILGYLRYDSPTALETINDLYKNELGWMMNLFQPSVKLVEKTRVGSRLKRTYDPPTTPLDRLRGGQLGDPAKLQELKKLRASLDPFKLSQIIEQKLDRIFALANARYIQRSLPSAIEKDDLSPIEKETFQSLSNTFAISVYIGKHKLPRG